MADLTDRQIQALYFHPRDRDGQVDLHRHVVPGATDRVSPQEAERAFRAMASALGVPPEKVDQAVKRKQQQKHG